MTKYLPGDGTWKQVRIRIQETECTHELMADQSLKFLCSALRLQQSEMADNQALKKQTNGSLDLNFEYLVLWNLIYK